MERDYGLQEAQKLYYFWPQGKVVGRMHRDQGCLGRYYCPAKEVRRRPEGLWIKDNPRVRGKERGLLEHEGKHIPGVQSEDIHGKNNHPIGSTSAKPAPRKEESLYERDNRAPSAGSARVGRGKEDLLVKFWVEGLLGVTNRHLRKHKNVLKAGYKEEKERS